MRPAYSQRSFRSPISQHLGRVVSSMARPKNQTSVCPVRRNFPFAKRRAKRLDAGPSAASASRYGAPESRGGDERLLKRALPPPVPELALGKRPSDEQKRHRASAYQQHAI